jgi:hypothetical protein
MPKKIITFVKFVFNGKKRKYWTLPLKYKSHNKIMSCLKCDIDEGGKTRVKQVILLQVVFIHF